MGKQVGERKGRRAAYHNPFGDLSWEEQWNVKTRLGDSIPGYEEFPWEVKEHIPDDRYLMIDIYCMFLGNTG